MPKTFYEPERRKDYFLKIRCNENELAMIVKLAKTRKCRTLSEYVRKLIQDDYGAIVSGFDLSSLSKAKTRK